MPGGTFYERPILNSPYEEPTQYHALDEHGQPLDEPPIQGRRPSRFQVPVPPARRRRRNRGDQAELELGRSTAHDTENDADAPRYDENPIINEIRAHVSTWRRIPNPNHWGVTYVTQRLLRHWREHAFSRERPFFCQIEAVETAIWLAEVAQGNPNYRKLWSHVVETNKEANPEILRVALKMATGAGKTTVMAMLIAWQTINAVRNKASKSFTSGFLIVTPGLTIRDRLRVLIPGAPDAYYVDRELVPADMVGDLNHAKIVITNYQALQLKETLEVNKVGRGLLQGRGPEVRTAETPGQMVRRVARELMGEKNIVVINDEAHHCYRERSGVSVKDATAGMDADERKEAKKQNQYARLWISGIEAFKKKLGVRTVYDLSATPFFLRGSGYEEGTLFPWTVSDFSLMDAIECGIVKLPRIPVADNHIGRDEMPVFRDLWKHIGKDMPKKGRGKANPADDPEALPDKLKTALFALYADYLEEDRRWKAEGLPTPPVFIVVCNNTQSSKLVAEWISGWERENEDGDMVFRHHGYLEKFGNYDEHGQRLAHPNTLLIDSAEIEAGGTIDKDFRKAMAPQIEQFKRERVQRLGAGGESEISDSELLREVMNTVGKRGRLGEQIRCVVSVSMLTEGWDTNSVTHILGVRAFGTQLLCEQVVGRGLRRYNYELNDDDIFNVEYSNVLGIPFDFTRGSIPATPKAPKPTTRVEAVRERGLLEIRFPRVTGYRIDLPQESLTATFTENSRLRLDRNDAVGPGETRLEGIVGEGVTISVAEAKDKRASTIAFDLAKYLMYRHFRDEAGEPKLHLFGQIKSICRRWLDEGYLECADGLDRWMLEYRSVAERACDRIYNAIVLGLEAGDAVRAVLDPYNPVGSTRHVAFNTTKEVYRTNPMKCHINYVVLDSDWEQEFARVVEDRDRVLRYVKNQALQFEVPYQDGGISRSYTPDFIAVIDDGNGPDDPLHLVGEVKGFRGADVQLKSETMKAKWIPGVNALGAHGRWAFHEFRDAFDFGRELDGIIDEAVAAGQTEAA